MNFHASVVEHAKSFGLEVVEQSFSQPCFHEKALQTRQSDKKAQQNKCSTVHCIDVAENALDSSWKIRVKQTISSKVLAAPLE